MATKYLRHLWRLCVFALNFGPPWHESLCLPLQPISKVLLLGFWVWDYRLNYQIDFFEFILTMNPPPPSQKKIHGCPLFTFSLAQSLFHFNSIFHKLELWQEDAITAGSTENDGSSWDGRWYKYNIYFRLEYWVGSVPNVRSLDKFWALQFLPFYRLILLVDIYPQPWLQILGQTLVGLFILGACHAL